MRGSSAILAAAGGEAMPGLPTGAAVNPIHALELVAAAAFCLLAAAGCATLPDTQLILERHTAQAVEFENARGPLSAQKNAAILAELKRKLSESGLSLNEKRE